MFRREIGIETEKKRKRMEKIKYSKEWKEKRIPFDKFIIELSTYFTTHETRFSINTCPSRCTQCTVATAWSTSCKQMNRKRMKHKITPTNSNSNSWFLYFFFFFFFYFTFCHIHYAQRQRENEQRVQRELQSSIIHNNNIQTNRQMEIEKHDHKLILTL